MTVQVFVVLFRGIGGKTQLPVAPLRAALAADGFGHVQTYINSGNAVLSSALSQGEVTERIAHICRTEFGFNKAVQIRGRAQWDEVITRNPFPEAVTPAKFLHAAVLEDDPEPGRVAALQALAEGRDRIAVSGRVAYLHTPDGFGRSRLAERFDRGIGVANTARNWNTVLKLRDLAHAVPIA